jgi:tetratricopeptide (TPR) repeat protein
MAVKRDATDYLTLAVLALLVAALVCLLVSWRRSAPAARHPEPASEDAEVRVVEEALGHYPPRPSDRDALAAWVAGNPGNSRALFELATLYYREGRLDAAAENYRHALVLNRSYADAKSPVSQVDMLKRVVDEGLRVYQREKEISPGDAHVRKVIKDLYFIRRSLAGGCD